METKKLLVAFRPIHSMNISPRFGNTTVALHPTWWAHVVGSAGLLEMHEVAFSASLVRFR